MRWLLGLAIVVALSGCRGGIPSGSLSSLSTATNSPTNFAASDKLVPPPQTGSFVPPQFAATGFTPSANSNAVAASTQSPFWNRYQPLSLSTSNPQPAPGFTANTNNTAGFGTPSSFQPSGSTAAANPFGTTPSSFNTSTNAVPTQYAGNNPLLAWANRFHNLIFSDQPQTGQWQSWSGNMPAAPTMNTGGFGSPPPGLTPTNFSQPSNNNNNAAWQTRPEPRSLRTTDTYGPEPAIRIPDSTLATAVNISTRSTTPSASPPPSYPAPSNVPTQSRVPSMPPRTTGNVSRPVASDPAWPELTSFPRAR